MAACKALRTIGKPSTMSGPIRVFSNKQIDRRAEITLHDTIAAPPKKKKRSPAKLPPGSYASPKTPDMAAPRTIPFAPLQHPLPKPFVRDGGNDFLNCPSKGFSC